MRIKKITNKNGICIVKYSDNASYAYNVYIKSYIVSWSSDGFINFTKIKNKPVKLNGQLHVGDIYRLYVGLPDLSRFKNGAYYSADKVIEFIETIRKLQLFG